MNKSKSSSMSFKGFMKQIYAAFNMNREDGSHSTLETNNQVAPESLPKKPGKSTFTANPREILAEDNGAAYLIYGTKT